jgi:hypothetical protein
MSDTTIRIYGVFCMAVGVAIGIMLAKTIWL